MADGAGGNDRLSGAAGGLARPSRTSEDIDLRRHIQQQRVVASNDGQHREIAMTYQHILYDVSEKIATITLHRPDRMNAWTPIMERDVRHAMEAGATDDHAHVLVHTAPEPPVRA